MSKVDKKFVWKKTLAQIEVKLDSPAHFKTWFKKTRLLDLKGKKAIIGVKNSYAADWLKKKHNDLIKTTLSKVSGKDLVPEFQYDKEVEKATEEDDKEEKSEEQPIFEVKQGVDHSTQVRIENANLNTKYTFSSFVVGPHNQLAHAAAVSVSEDPGKSYNPLFIYGYTGIGKTHLLQAIGRHILDKDPTKKILYCPTENFLIDVVQAIKKNKTEKLRAKYRKLDVLLIDDIQLISKAKETQNEFFNTFNVLFHSSKQIVITSDRTPEEIPNIEQRLISRFQGGMVADIAQPDFEERLAILEKKNKDFGLQLSDKTLRFIADLVQNNIRQLEGALQKITLFNNMKKEDLSQAEIAKILKKDPNSKRKKVKLSTIFKKVAKEFDVTVKDIKGPRRTKDVAFARQVCMYILREEFGYKLQDVAKFLKRNDHTTAIHAIDKVKSMIESNVTFKDQITNLISSIYKPIGG